MSWVARLALTFILAGLRGLAVNNTDVHNDVNSLAQPNCSSVRSCNGPWDEAEYVRQYLNASIYNPLQAPSKLCPPFATKVELQYYLTYLGNVDEKLGLISTGGYLRTWWKDPRLAFNDSARGGCMDMITLSPSSFRSIWRPDIYVDNLVDLKEEFDKFSGTYIFPDGTVWWSRQTMMVTKCDMRFGKLPYDDHLCNITVSSYSHPSAVLRLTARGGELVKGFTGVGMLGGQIFSDVWEVEGGKPDGFETKGLIETRFDDTWDYLHFQLSFVRRSKYLFDQIIIPDMLFLVLAYCAFYVDPKSGPARATMALIPILIMRTLANAIFSSLPQISSNVWLSDYLMFSMYICCLGALEFALVQYYLQREQVCVDKFKALLQKRDAARVLLQEAQDKDTTVFTLLKEMEPVRVKDHYLSYTARDIVDSDDDTESKISPSSSLPMSAVRSLKSFHKDLSGAMQTSSEDDDERDASVGGIPGQLELPQVLTVPPPQPPELPSTPAKDVDHNVVAVESCVLNAKLAEVLATCGESTRSSVGNSRRESKQSIASVRLKKHQTKVLEDEVRGARIVRSISHKPREKLERTVSGMSSISVTSENFFQPQAAKASGRLTEADLTILVYAHRIFQSYTSVTSGVNQLPPYLVRKVLTYFNVYLTVEDTAQVMCAFLRDCGHPTPVDTHQVTMRFGQFMEFLFDVEHYMLSIPERFKHPFSQSIPYSMRVDYFARWFFPICVAVKVLIFCRILDWY